MNYDWSHVVFVDVMYELHDGARRIVEVAQGRVGILTARVQRVAIFHRQFSKLVETLLQNRSAHGLQPATYIHSNFQTLPWRHFSK